jgi:hypothetical protein
MNSVSGDGQPDMSGTVLAETAAFQGSAEAGWPYTKLLKTAFVAPYAATAGQTLCLMVNYSSGTIDASNSCTWKYESGRSMYRAGVGGYLESYSGSATVWYGNGTYQPVMTVTTDKSYDLGGYPLLGDANYYMGVSGYRYANKITVPAGGDIEMHVVGLQINGSISNGTDSIIIGAWDSDGDELIADNTISTLVSVGQQMGDIGFYLGAAEIYFKETLTMTSGNSYYLGIENPGSSSLYGAFKVFDDWTADCNRSWPMGANIEAAVYLPFGGGWTDSWAGSGSGKTRFLINPIVSDIHGTASGGSAKPSTTLTMGVFG